MINDNHGKAPMGRHVTARGNAPGISGKNTPSPVGAAHFWFFDRNSETEPDDRADSGATTKGTNNTYRRRFLTTANGRECNNPFLEGMLRFIRVASRPFAVKKQALAQAARGCRGSVLECGRPCRFWACSKAVQRTALHDAAATFNVSLFFCVRGFA